MADYKDMMCGVNDYGEEGTLKAFNALVYMFNNILINEPGFIPEYPFLGIGINTRRHILENDSVSLSKLSTDVNEQLNFLFPELFINAEVNVLKRSDGITPYIEIRITLKAIEAQVITRYSSIHEIDSSIKYKNYNN